MSCPICFENNTMMYLSCSHGICYQCISGIQNNTLNGCPICRQGNTINYQTLFPGTPNYYPTKIENWDNNDYKDIKGDSQDLTSDEIEWIKSKWGGVTDKKSPNQLVINNNYVIVINNNIYFGKLILRNRNNSNEYLFDQCQILNRHGSYYNSSPPTRSINLINSNYKVYQII